MTNIYYTAREGRRNANGHTITRGEVYRIVRGEVDTLENIGEYTHQSGGAGIEFAILVACQIASVDVGGGYYARWRDAVNLIQL